MSEDPQRPLAAGEERRVVAWIGQGVVVEGRITSTQDLRIDGKVDGTIEVGSHGLTLGTNAMVTANLIGRSILISGRVVGNVTATERLEVQPTASIEGDISAPRLVVAEGAIIKGRIDAGGNRPAKDRTA
jgi:cytoskeletal protein CcmA (bactofilin family)